MKAEPIEIINAVNWWTKKNSIYNGEVKIKKIIKEFRKIKKEIKNE